MCVCMCVCIMVLLSRRWDNNYNIHQSNNHLKKSCCSFQLPGKISWFMLIIIPGRVDFQTELAIETG